jgi:hypothetical protein
LKEAILFDCSSSSTSSSSIELIPHTNVSALTGSSQKLEGRNDYSTSIHPYKLSSKDDIW